MASGGLEENKIKRGQSDQIKRIKSSKIFNKQTHKCHFVNEIGKHTFVIFIKFYTLNHCVRKQFFLFKQHFDSFPGLELNTPKGGQDQIIDLTLSDGTLFQSTNCLPIRSKNRSESS